MDYTYKQFRFGGFLKRRNRAPLIHDELAAHFGGTRLHELVTATRTFPMTARLDLQTALNQALSGALAPKKTLSAQPENAFETISFAYLINGDQPIRVSPLEYDEIDIGEAMPVRCLKRALWLCQDGELPFAVLLSELQNIRGGGGVHLELAFPAGGSSEEFSRRLMDQIEKKVFQAGSYRGKVLSLEVRDDYRGNVAGIRVHRLKSVARHEVILPENTIKLLERNIARFIEHRDKLSEMRLGIKKGLLFYGPPGTGKTHTIHYLASQMKDHTTLLITAEQVAYLDNYIQLARFLQPAMIVIEDVDLIARSRTSSRSACEESMLNKLLNEMDGLREDARVLFVLTSNRPEDLEQAITARPGRIDQAIEFPLPDDEGRRKLIQLYAGKMSIDESLLGLLVQRSKGGGGAFIKELMRRSAQYLIEAGGARLLVEHVEAALDEMIFSGGGLNAKLLGFATTDSAAVRS